MSEILPIKILRDEDSQIFGSLNVALSRLASLGFPVASGIVATPPNLILKTALEQFDFGSKEVYQQSLTLVKKEIEKIEIPEILERESKNHKKFLVEDVVVEGVRKLWILLLHGWIEQVKQRLWRGGFYPGITEGLDSKVVVFVGRLEALGSSWFDPIADDVVISIKEGKLDPSELKKIDELTQLANKKLFMPYTYEWILDKGIKLTRVSPYTPKVIPDLIGDPDPRIREDDRMDAVKSRAAVKVFLDLSTGFTLEKEPDGVYISSERIFDLNRPETSWEELVFKLVEAAQTFPGSPVLMKLADMSEGMGKVRGALRLLHQKSLLNPLIEAILFCREKKELKNIHLVIPFVRGVNELMQVKKELAVKKLIRRNSLQIWLEIAVPENIINLEDYLVTGIDGIVLNLDELASYLSGFDHKEQELSFYKSEVNGLLRFLEDGLKFITKSKIPFIAYGSLNLNPEVLEFLVEKGVYGIVVERYEAHSMIDLLHQAEKRMILSRAV